MARIAPLMLLPPLAFAALAATFLWGMNRDDPGSVPSAMIGRQAPPVPATTLPGKTQLTDAMLREPGVQLVPALPDRTSDPDGAVRTAARLWR